MLASFRDVGGHVNLSSGVNGSTLIKRLGEGIPQANRTTWLPHDAMRKALFIEIVVLNGSIYGCEVTSAEDGIVSKLPTAICNAVSKRSKRRCTDIIFYLLDREIEPRAAIFLRRLVTMRRMLPKIPTLVKS